MDLIDRIQSRSSSQILITQDRYNGQFSGGNWLSMPWHYNQFRCLGNFYSGDNEAEEFWENDPEEVSRWIGRGNTIEEAFNDMEFRRTLTSEAALEESKKRWREQNEF